MKKVEIDKKVETALNSLDHVRRVGPVPFFYTRVQARLNRRGTSIWENISGFLARPAVALAVICLIILLNTLVIFYIETVPANAMQTGFFSSDDSDVDTIAFYDVENISTDTP